MHGNKFSIIRFLAVAFFVMVFTGCPDPNGETTATPTYTVKFIANADTANPADQTIVEGGKVVEPIAVSKENYSLEGWYKEDTFLTKWNFVIDTVSENLSLYANWAILPITLDKTSISLIVGGEPVTLIATVNTTDIRNKNVTWSSSNETIASVSNGIVTAIAVGQATITATLDEDSSKSATCVVIVGTVPTTITINLPNNETGKVETVVNTLQSYNNGTNTTFYGMGALFTATVQGDSNVISTISWEIIAAQEYIYWDDSGRWIGQWRTSTVQGSVLVNGILSVATADHGKKLTIKATSAVDSSKTDQKEIFSVSILPSYFYGTWTENQPFDGHSDPLGQLEISAITSSLGIDQYATVQITHWSPRTNTDASYKNEYPVGFRIEGSGDGFSRNLDIYLHKTDAWKCLGDFGPSSIYTKVN
jgi:uncharacterized repeat protein (TIGR02543 family)